MFKLKYIRWAIIIPFAFFGIWLGILSAILLVSFFENLCPLSEKISGLCIASWYKIAEDFSVTTGASLSAFFSVTTGFIIAPTHKIHVAFFIFFCGFLYGAYFLYNVGSSFIVPFLAAISSGLIALTLAKHHNKKYV